MPIKTALYFGSYNPVHLGHLIIAAHILEFEEIDELWFVVSPQNPLKQNIELESFEHRLKMLELAIIDEPKMKVCDIESKLSQPSYTINTLNLLAKENTDREFCIIIGEDNLENFHLWKDYETILENHNLIVFPRNSENAKADISHKNIKHTDAPLINLSSTIIRNIIKNKLPYEHLVDKAVADYILKNSLYL